MGYDGLKINTASGFTGLLGYNMQYPYRLVDTMPFVFPGFVKNTL